MKRRFVLSALLPGIYFALALLLIPSAEAHQTLGGITGTVTDTSGAVVSGATVTLIGGGAEAVRALTNS